MTEKSLLVIGAGVMGLSTALAYKRAHPSSTVTLINDPTSVLPASHDTGKIIRTAYVLEDYASLAAEAMQLWEADPLYSRFWHKSGWVVVHGRSRNGKQDNDQSGGDESSLNLEPGEQIITQEQFRDVYYGGVPPAPGVLLTSQKATGWVEASNALELVLQQAISEGIIYIEDEAVSLLWKADSCIGVQLQSGREIDASSTVVAMGCWTPKFLTSNGVHETSKVVTAGVSVVGVKLSENDYENFKDMPILAVAEKGEILPPNKDRILKINNAISFSPPPTHLPTPPADPSIPTTYTKENLELLHRFLPSLQHSPVAFTRYCYDSISPTQDFIIKSAAGKKGLFLAYAGSFHGWKFLPNIGSYVVALVEGRLEERWVRRWSGEIMERPVLIHPDVVPDRVYHEE